MFGGLGFGDFVGCLVLFVLVSVLDDMVIAWYFVYDG